MSAIHIFVVAVLYFLELNLSEVFLIMEETLWKRQFYVSISNSMNHSKKDLNLKVVWICSELLRYRQFLGMQQEQEAIAEAAAALKAKTDFTSPLTLSSIDAARAEGTPADRYDTIVTRSKSLFLAA